MFTFLEVYMINDIQFKEKERNIHIMNEKIKTSNTKNIQIMPCVAMRDIVLFPNMVMHFDVARSRSVLALKAALDNDRMVFLTTQKDLIVDKPDFKDLYKIGVIAEIKQIIKTPEGYSRVLVEGLYKAKAQNIYLCENGYLEAQVKRLPTYSREPLDDYELQAVMREVKRTFREYAENVPRMPKEILASVYSAQTPKDLFESVVFNISISAEYKQMLLEIKTVGEKLTQLISMLSNELEVLSIEKEIQSQVSQNIEENQREYYLREQLKVIRSELGDDSEEDDVEFYTNKICELNLDEERRDKLLAEVRRLEKMPSGSQEAVVIRTYLDTCLALPWNKSTEDTANIEKARKILDADHYGLKKVKERILEILSVKALNPDVKGQIICLAGPPGVGKTSIGRSIAHALGRQYVRVSLGGVKDESDIRGHRKTYVGAMPGRIITALKQAGTNNPVMLLDEIDKMSNDFRGDPSSAMLEVLDSEQNKEFRDHYIEMPFDLSNVLFITTANNLNTVQAPLLDRMEVIELSSYTREEKFNIAKRHLIPKQLKANGMKATQMKITDDCIYTLVDSYTREAGVRKLERCIASLCRKAAKEIVENDVKKVTFKESNIEEYLGVKKYFPDLVAKESEVGLVNGLAWTAVGGVTMPMEVLVLDGKGEITLTGSLGDVMKESAKIAVSYCRSVADKFNIDKEFYKTKDLHIHAPEGAVPKDGPSAGVTMVTAMISALSGTPVKSSVAMTGEITLRGKVLPIGGLREKSMAAYKSGIKTIIIPYDNKADIEEIDETVKSSVEIVLAKNISDVLETALDIKEIEDKIPLGMIAGETSKESITAAV